MSNENTKEHLVESQIELILPPESQKYSLKLKSLSPQQAKEIYGWLVLILNTSNHDRDPVHVPYKFATTLEDTSVVIKGNPTNNSNTQDIEDLVDAVETLGKSLTYLSSEKTNLLLKQLEELLKKEEQEQKRKNEIAKGQEKHRKKYLRLAEKHGLDPNLIFANPESALTKNPIIITSGNKKSPKTK